ncbi:hypothetical protein GH5_07580 [Leishmania sp. Ghana 2012 LV757]|uniref:hypothetical protein n=1 Tax=Leishmania sp. Ghana 2012 LV757 TaxID=2803181 RepID=UPI001B66FD91|nr:hypothetical protein GH5_07580 [Leishmania sp. Ghana 2012 LV757]
MFAPLNCVTTGLRRWVAVAAARPLSPVGATAQRTASSPPFAAALSMTKRFAATTSANAGAGGARNGGGPSFFGAYRAFRQERNAGRGRQYMVLSMYLDRLPPGLRELLLWSPLLALLHFMCHQARAYYLEEEEPWYYVIIPRRWRYRGDGGGGGAAVHVSSLLQRAPSSSKPTTTVAADVDCSSATYAFPNVRRGGESTATSSTITYAFAASGVQDAAPLVGSPPVVSFHEVRVRHAHTDQGAPPATTPPTPPLEEAYRNGVWGAPLVVIRDPGTQRVIGYTTAG